MYKYLTAKENMGLIEVAFWHQCSTHFASIQMSRLESDCYVCNLCLCLGYELCL
jgi:hypothetical protein